MAANMSTICEANRWPYAIHIVDTLRAWTDTETKLMQRRKSGIGAEQQHHTESL